MIAVNAGGAESQPSQTDLYLIPDPLWLSESINQEPSSLQAFLNASDVTYTFKGEFPKTHRPYTFKIPDYVPLLGGKWGLKDTYGNFKGSFTSTNGKGQAKLLGQTGFTISNTSINGKVGGSGAFIFNQQGLKFQTASFNVEIEGKREQKVKLLDAVPGLHQRSL